MAEAAILEPGDRAWADTQAMVRHDVYHRPEYARLDAGSSIAFRYAEAGAPFRYKAAFSPGGQDFHTWRVTGRPSGVRETGQPHPGGAGGPLPALPLTDPPGRDRARGPVTPYSVSACEGRRRCCGCRPWPAHG
ncbi:hypothetical protein [Actinoplanes sp. NPDC048796]|uniref:hypothetical protein n=1 Tax=unclassified Actinoplanes TaxID=2626549 RepID=UPI00340C003F